MSFQKICFSSMIFLSLLACSETTNGVYQSGSPAVTRQFGDNCPPSNTEDQSPIAKINGQPVTAMEINPLIKGRMLKVEQDIYEVKSDALESYIDQKLLDLEAKTQGGNVGKLLKEKVYDKIGEVTDKDAEDFYNENKQRFGKQSFDETKNRIKGQMANYLKQQAKADYLQTLREKNKIEINLEPPRLSEVKVAANDPTVGNSNAPIQIVEFSEFQCPFCKRARPAIDRILKEYKGKIQYVFRDYPLGFHSHAKAAANAAHCAGQQGKYWEYNSGLFENQGNLTKSGFLSDLAVQLKLDKTKFEKCQSENTFFKDIDQDQQEGSEMGVSGTPAYFINGIFLSGALPYEKFKQVIDAELARKK